VPMSGRVPAPLYSKIRTVCQMMLSAHYYEEANWLWMAVGSPQYCQSKVAAEALRSAAKVAREFSFVEVTTWIEREVLG
jgi:hypothetical protein